MSVRILIATLVLQVATASTIAADPIRAGRATWINNEHTYEIFIAQGISWEAAAALASSTPGRHLATITSSEENHFITSLVTPITCTGCEFWLGAFQDPLSTVTPDENWSWTTGERFGFTNWGPGEPNDFYGPASEQYLGLWGVTPFFQLGAWNDGEGDPLTYVSGFITETADPVPEPSTMILFGTGAMVAAARSRARRRGNTVAPPTTGVPRNGM